MSEAEAKGADLGPILRAYPREALERDQSLELDPSGAYPLPLWPFGFLQATLDNTKAALADRDPCDHAATVEGLMRRYGLPEQLRDRLGIGVLEAEVRRLEEAIRRAKGEVPLVFATDAAEEPAPPRPGPYRSASRPEGAEGSADTPEAACVLVGGTLLRAAG